MRARYQIKIGTGLSTFYFLPITSPTKNTAPHYFSYLHIHSQLDTHPFLPYNNLIKKNLDNFSIFLNIKKGKYYYTWLFAPRTSQISHNHFLKRKRSRNGGFYGKTLCKPG